MAQRRIGSANSATRSAILDAAEEIMSESGYAAVTSRRLAEQAGLKSQLVHYYFPSMDDLFISLYRRVVEELVGRQNQIPQAEKPLRALWELSNDPRRVALTYEFVALANHRKNIRAEIAESGNFLRENESRIMASVLSRKGLGGLSWLPMLSAVFLEGFARSLALQGALGITVGQAEARGAIDRIIDLLDR